MSKNGSSRSMARLPQWVGLLCFFGMLSNTVAAGAPLFPTEWFPAGNAPVAIAVVDVDGDGREDILVADVESHELSVLKGLEGVMFSVPWQFPTGVEPHSLVVEDLNGDGFEDVAVANSRTNDISIFLGRGSLPFGAQTSIPTGYFPTSIVVGDFNGDGLPDLATANDGSNDLSILLGRGDGSFFPQAQFGAGSRPVSMVVTDFNGDGVEDLAVANKGSDDLSILLGQGDGTFLPEDRLAAGRQPAAIVAADFNGDGKTDLAVANSFSDDISILLGIGDGRFGNQTRILAGSDASGIIAGDFTGDTVVDLALSNSGSDDVSVLSGRGNGTFDGERRFPAGGAPSGLAASDLNEDGREDLLVAARSSDVVAILLGGENGQFIAPIRLNTGFGQYNVVAAGDFNGDRISDMAVAHTFPHVVVSLQGRGDGSFENRDSFYGGDCPTSITMADFNHDGNEDLAVANGSCPPSSPEVVVILGFGDGTFGRVIRYSAGTGASALAAGDFNSDGNTDLAVAKNGENLVAVLLGLGDGTFSIQGSFPTGTSPGSLAVGDFNHDGIPDLAVANREVYLRGDVSVLLGRGDGVFLSQTRYQAGQHPIDLAVGDLNRDGFADLLVANAGTEGVSYLQGLVTGGFAPQSLLKIGFDLTSMVIADFDGDRNPDLAVSEQGEAWFYPGDVVIIHGRGNGTFGSLERFDAGALPVSLSVGDFNRDGNPDLALGHQYTGSSPQTWVLLNQMPLRNRPPLAAAGTDMRAECDSPGGGSVRLDGSDSTDPDSTPGTNDDIVLFDWFLNFGEASEVHLGSGASLTTTLPLGDDRITLRVTDTVGESDTDETMATIVDTIPPELSATSPQALLWPPNHRMVPVEALVTANDACGTSSIMLASIASSELDDAPGTGDGNTTDDITEAQLGAADFDFQLRAERSGTGEGRVYNVVYMAMDTAGNRASASFPVLVPRNLGSGTDPVLVSAEQASSGTVLTWNSVPGAFSYKVIRGTVGNLRETLNFIDLGTVTCIQPDTPVTTIQGHEDAEIPASGNAYFYLVAYDDGQDSGYGSDTAASSRVASGGGCGEVRK